MRIYSTREFRRKLAQCLAEAATETIYVDRPGHKLIQLVLVPAEDVKTIKAQSKSKTKV